MGFRNETKQAIQKVFLKPVEGQKTEALETDNEIYYSSFEKGLFPQKET
ncbi:MAG: hypothetical protein JRI90_14620 [Deltaproteobacteria bacterium]|nr:hypothetical protein [Deltaproteobacteria bacterium]